MKIIIKIEKTEKPISWEKYIKEELKHFKVMSEYAGKTNLQKDKKEFWDYIIGYAGNEVKKYENKI
ncbi:MAG: hypothetical protein JXN64_06435 [Spirochaetes bacterium]|nr:hypothetical protein [Spirochaetota bacterium]